MTPFEVYRMRVGEVLHTPSCRVIVKVVGVVRNSDSPALLVQPVTAGRQGAARPRRATVGQLSGYHVAAACAAGLSA